MFANRFATSNGMRAACALMILVSLVIAGCKDKVEQQKIAQTHPLTVIVKPCEVFDSLPTAIDKSAEVNYSGKIKLLGITTDRLSDKQLRISYYWQQLDDLGKFRNIFVHFVSKENKIIFQNDHDFCKNHTFDQLKNKFAKETYIINISETVTGQKVDIKIGVYSMELKSRLKINSAPGIFTDDKKTRATVKSVSIHN